MKNLALFVIELWYLIKILVKSQVLGYFLDTESLVVKRGNATSILDTISRRQDLYSKVNE